MHRLKRPATLAVRWMLFVALVAGGVPVAQGARVAHAAPVAGGVDVRPLDHAREVAGGKALAMHAVLPFDASPYYTLPDGSWEMAPLTRWNSGFLPASMWLEYGRTGDPGALQAAQRRTQALASVASFTGTMDIGFILMSSFGEGYRHTSDPQYRERLLEGARTLSRRYSPAVGAIRSRPNPDGFYVNVDTMMNVELFYWAAKHGGSSAMREMASRQAELTARDLMREDGSSYHYALYDEATGVLKERGQYQGYADESTWSRGQAWVIHGMSIAYRETGDLRFLEAARRASDYWEASIPDDRVPYWDFDAPAIPDEPRDSSAAAIAASAFVELAGLDPDPARRQRFSEMARSTLESLASPAYLAGPEFPAALKHGTFHAHKGAVDGGTPWGDYYFGQALARSASRVQRVAGHDRYATAVAASRYAFPAARTVVIASGEGFSDALSASALAGVHGAPVLLTRREGLPQSLAAELERLGARSAVVVGGEAAVGARVVRQLAVESGLEVTRIAGADRYETAALVARVVAAAGGPGFERRFVLVSGETPADALSAAPLAYAAGAPVVLTRRDRLPAGAEAVLSKARTVTLVGGTAAVSDEVAGRLVLIAPGINVTRIAGRDRYETSGLLAARMVRDGTLENAVVGTASGQHFADALTGGAAMGVKGGPLLLVRDRHNEEPLAETGALRLGTRLALFGGEGVFRAQAERALQRALP